MCSSSLLSATTLHLNRLRTCLAAAALLGSLFCQPSPVIAQDQPKADAPWLVLPSPDDSFTFTFYKDQKPVATLGAVGWGPNWGWRPFGVKAHNATEEVQVASDFVSDQAAGQILHVALDAKQSGTNSISFRYTLNAEKDVPLTMFVATLSPDKAFQEGSAVITGGDGQTKQLPLAFNMGSAGPTAKLTFDSAAAGAYAATIDPPTALGIDHGVRVMLAGSMFPAGTRTVTVTLTFPEAVRFAPRDEDLRPFVKTMVGPDWFAFTPTNNLGPSALGFEDWLDKPAGRHGGVRMVGDRFEFEDKTPVKFWGTNLAYGSSAPSKEAADFTAARFAKWGVNAVRMHKFTGAGWEGIGDPNDATRMDSKGLDRLDYFASQLTSHGVYYGWSHTYHFHPKLGNRDRLLAYDEIASNLGGDTYALINFAPDVQDLLIESVVNLLHHKNPYTGKTYAEDPALCYIEAQNEDDIFFYTSSALNKCPTYLKRTTADFAEWLRQKYGSTDALGKAWVDALPAGETLEAANIAVQTNPWNMSSDGLPKSGGQRQRLLDNAAFFHALQDRFYAKFAGAMRGAGYRGPLVGSPWFAPGGVPLYNNLQSDARVGYVDRHDYFGGELFDSMLAQPGSGNFSMGLQQVAGRPFGLSEWIHVYPSLYSAEGPAIIAAYGFGLQGWDASYEFQSQAGTTAFTNDVGSPPYGVWNVDVPTQLGQFPVLARMIARGDIKEGAVISTRRISDEDLATGNFNFSDKITQQGDFKTITGSVPPAALAAGRCLVEFTDKTQASTLPDMAKYEQNGVICSDSGQLAWDTGGKGSFTVDTLGTKAVVGFAEGRQNVLGDVRVVLECPYASVFVTAAGKEENLGNAKRALVTALARNANAGMTYFSLQDHVLDNGKPPIMLEPVKATIVFAGRGIAAVNVLDHDGVVTGRTVPVKNGEFTLDGTRDKTPFYEVVFAEK